MWKVAFVVKIMQLHVSSFNENYKLQLDVGAFPDKLYKQPNKSQQIYHVIVLEFERKTHASCSTSKTKWAFHCKAINNAIFRSCGRVHTCTNYKWCKITRMKKKKKKSLEAAALLYSLNTLFCEYMRISTWRLTFPTQNIAHERIVRARIRCAQGVWNETFRPLLHYG